MATKRWRLRQAQPQAVDRVQAGPTWAPFPDEPWAWDLRLLCANFDQLMARRGEIVDWPPWRDALAHGCGWWLAFCSGGGHYALGALLSALGRGEMLFRDSGPAYIYRVSGSPLSGRGGANALRPADGTERRVCGPNGAVGREAIGERPGPTSWSLGAILTEWGVPVPDIEIRDEREVFGRFVHGEGVVYDAEGRVRFRAPLARPGDPLPIGALEEDFDALCVRSDALQIIRHRRRSSHQVIFVGPLPSLVVSGITRWLLDDWRL